MCLEQKKVQELATVMGTGGAAGISESADLERKWYIACVGSNREKSSRERLMAMGYETFVASQEEVKVYKNGDRKKRKKIERVVITQYIFLHITETERRKVVEEPCIRFFMLDRSYGQRTFATVSDEQMRLLRRMLGQTSHTVQFAASEFTIGEEVTVTGLGTQDLTGHVVRLRGESGAYVGVRIDVLGCAYLEVDPANLLKK
jgi:transcription antitermination factor NusG